MKRSLSVVAAAVFISLLTLAVVLTRHAPKDSLLSLSVSAQTSCPAGQYVTGSQALIGVTCAVVPYPVMYSASGTALTNLKCIQDSATSATTTGLWSMNISAVGLTSIRTVQVQAVSTASTAAGLVNAGMITPTTSLISGITTVPSASVLGLIPLTANPTSAVVYVTACGV